MRAETKWKVMLVPQLVSRYHVISLYARTPPNKLSHTHVIIAVLLCECAKLTAPLRTPQNCLCEWPITRTFCWDHARVDEKYSRGPGSGKNWWHVRRLEYQRSGAESSRNVMNLRMFSKTAEWSNDKDENCHNDDDADDAPRRSQATLQFEPLARCLCRAHCWQVVRSSRPSDSRCARAVFKQRNAMHRHRSIAFDAAFWRWIRHASYWIIRILSPSTRTRNCLRKYKHFLCGNSG